MTEQDENDILPWDEPSPLVKPARKPRQGVLAAPYVQFLREELQVWGLVRYCCSLGVFFTPSSKYIVCCVNGILGFVFSTLDNFPLWRQIRRLT